MYVLSKNISPKTLRVHGVITNACRLYSTINLENKYSVSYPYGIPDRILHITHIL